MKRLFIFLFTVAPFLCPAQKQGREYLDSFLTELPKASVDTDRAKILGSLSRYYVGFAPDSGIMYGRQGLDLAKKYGKKKVMGYIYRSMGLNYRYSGDYDLAQAYYDSGFTVAKELNDSAAIAAYYDNVSILYIDKSDYPKALNYAFKSLAMNEQIKKKNLASNYTNISIIYSDMGNYPKAIDYLEKAVKISKEVNDKPATLAAMSNLGRTYLMTGENEKALKIELEALKEAEQSGAKNVLLPIYSYIATAYYNLNDVAKASEYFEKGLKSAREVKNKKSVAENLGNLGEIYLGMAIDSIRAKSVNNFKLPSKSAALAKSIAYSQESAELHLELHNLRDLSANYNSLYMAWDLAGNKGKALEAYKLYADFRDSVFSKQNKDKIAGIEKQRELDSIKQQVKIDSLKLAQHDLEVTKERNEKIYLVIGMCLLVVVIFFVARERKKSEHLLLNILPDKIAERLKNKEHPIADHFAAASIIFIDMAGFTTLSENRDPKETVNILNDIFTKFDALAEKHGLEKIKTIGDCYMAVAGLPHPRNDHAIAAADMAVSIQHLMQDYKAPEGTSIKFRIGLDCGPVVAGVIGKKKFIYDLWGNAVNTASRMESTGVAGEIHCTDNFRNELSKEHAYKYEFTSRGIMDVKGIGQMETWLIRGKTA